MKILFETDVHIKEIGSLANESRTQSKYSVRLDLIIKSFGYLYQIAQQQGVDVIIHGGDTLDKSIILAKEGHAIKECFAQNTINIPEFVLIGNHDRKDRDSHGLAILAQYPNVHIVDKPTVFKDEITMLPYTDDFDNEIFSQFTNKVLISHIDILGMVYTGNIVSSKGFDPKVISNNFKIVLNGHIHTPSVLNNIINTGSFMGSGFGDNYSAYYPSMFILDTDALSLTRIENPFAIRYETIKAESLVDVKQQLDRLTAMDRYFYLRVQCPNPLKTEARLMVDNYLKNYPKILSAIVIGLTRETTNRLDAGAVSIQPSIQTMSNPVDILSSYVKTLDVAQMPAPLETMLRLINENFLVGGGE